MFLGDTNGKIYKFSSAAVADDTTAIGCQYITSRTDLKLPDRWKTIHNVELIYIDKGAVSITISISSSEGDTVVSDWVTNTQTVGTAAAPGTIKSKDFGFVTTGRYFNFKIYHSAATGTFQWVQLNIEFEDMSEYWELST